MTTLEVNLTRKTATLPGPMGSGLLSDWREHEAQTTTYQAPVVWDHARGLIVTDVDGNEYIDWTSGVLVTNVGHCHPRHVEAIQAAVARLMNSYDFPTPDRIELARRMCEVAPENLDRAFFLTTGSEAVEAALRVAKRFTGNYEIVTFFGGFHGRTYGAMSAGGLKATKRQFGPTMPGVMRAPFPYCYRCPLGLKPDSCNVDCLNLLDDVVNANSTGSLAAVMIEPYLGAAGFVFPPEGYLKKLEAWARERDMIFILDEVQSSFGRTGRMFALEWEQLRPQLLCLAKGLGSGIPNSCLMAEREVIGALGQGEMSSTCGGNPVASAASLAVLDILRDEGLVENADRIGRVMKSRLEQLQERSRCLGDVRGRGLVIGLEIVKDRATKEPAPELTRRIINRAAEEGLLIGAVGPFGNCLRVAPPLVISEAQAHTSLDIFEHVLLELEG